MVSIIVPIYNVQEYLCCCVDSLLSQSYKDIEILLVDDGSTDKCPDICDKYHEKNPAIIKALHKKNGGLSDARNFGLREAKGEFVLFIDSDDYIHPSMAKLLTDEAIINHSDIVTCKYKKVKLDLEMCKDSDPERPDSCETMTGEELLHGIYTGKVPGIDFVVWNKLYKRSLFLENHLCFPVGKYHEDEYITYKLLSLADKVSVVDLQLYFYRIRSGSIMMSKIPQKEEDFLEGMLSAIKYFKKATRVYEDALYRYLMALNQLENEYKKSDKHLSEKYRFTYLSAMKEYGPFKQSAFKRRLRAWIYKYFMMIQ